jgi:hypothetical protein
MMNYHFPYWKAKLPPFQTPKRLRPCWLRGYSSCPWYCYLGALTPTLIFIRKIAGNSWQLWGFVHPFMGSLIPMSDGDHYDPIRKSHEVFCRICWWICIANIRYPAKEKWKIFALVSRYFYIYIYTCMCIYYIYSYIYIYYVCIFIYVYIYIAKD